MALPTTGHRPAGGNSVAGSWDVTSSIGVTALAVAAARATEAERPDALVRDRYAADFVRAADHPMPGFESSTDGPGAEAWSLLVDILAVRSRVLDDLVLHAVTGGVRQVVILAAGLDARAHRLAWPTGTTVYEVDQPDVLRFKDAVLDATPPGCDRRPVPADLRDDWASALTGAGFDASVPTAWLLEGLLPYLPAQAEADVFATLDRLAAPGSHAGVEALAPTDADAYVRRPEVRDLGASIGTDLLDLWNTEQRTDVTDRLTAAGWVVRPRTLSDLGDGLGRRFTGPFGELAGRCRIVDAVKR